MPSESTQLLDSSNHQDQANVYGISYPIETHNEVQNLDSEPVTSNQKSIGILGSVSIAVNSLAGPAILQLPFQYQQSGIIPTTVCLIAVAILSCYTSLHMANAVSQIPGNSTFNRSIEFSDTFRFFWSQRAFKATQILFFLTTACMNIAAIVDTAETVDSSFGFHWKTVGLSTSNGWETWSHEGPCTRRQVKRHKCDPFGGKHDEDDYGVLLTAGYVLTAVVFLPICLADLKENAAWQIFGFALLVGLSVYFCLALSEFPLQMEHGLSLWGREWSDMMGVILFNFSLVLAIPAWLHEKKESVSVVKTITFSTVLSTVLYIAVGLIGALAIPKVNVNMLSPMLSGAYGAGVQMAASLFAFFIIGLDIPLFSVLTRYNLIHSGVCSQRTANILVVWIPWSVSWLLYRGEAVGVLLDWSGVILTSAVAFLLPLYIARRALTQQDGHIQGSVPIYGTFRVTKAAQIALLDILLSAASLAVALAIAGQIAHTERRMEYQASAEYLDSSKMTELKSMVNGSQAENHG